MKKKELNHAGAKNLYVPVPPAFQKPGESGILMAGVIYGDGGYR
jgi:hypothetical protein